ncbi:MAG: GNAT family N-acetyltransferase [Dehalococcoidales bacterium]|nr:GNAT family N-acetyltransferase [Dehalococcoidales bacterium]
MNLIIRPMTKQDKKPVMHILKNTPEFLDFEVDIAEELIDANLKDPVGSGYVVQVAEIDGKVVGYINYGSTPVTQGTWDIYWMAVAADHQGQGIGKALIRFVEKDIAKAQGRLIVIETAGKAQYEKTRRFHFSLGYEEVARVPEYYAPGDDKLILCKRLK